MFAGTANLGFYRPDIGALFGASMALSGFQLPISTLPSGTYTLVAFAHSEISGTFSNVQTVSVTLQQAAAQIVIDTPTPGVARTPFFFVTGWAVDPVGAGGGTGVDVVHVWAYPASGAPPVFLGQAAYGGSRSDVASFVGSAFTNCGYGLTVTTASLAPGDYTLVVFARSVSTGQFRSQTVRITVQ